MLAGQGDGGLVCFLSLSLSLSLFLSPLFLLFFSLPSGMGHVGVGIVLASYQISRRFFQGGSALFAGNLSGRRGGWVFSAWEMSGADALDGSSLAVCAAGCFRVWSIVGVFSVCVGFGEKITAGFGFGHLDMSVVCLVGADGCEDVRI